MSLGRPLSIVALALVLVMPASTRADEAPGAPAAPAAEGPTPRPASLRYANRLNLDLELGYGDTFDDARKGNGLVRGRVGALFVRDDSFWQIGATTEYSSVSRTAFGVQAEYLHLQMGGWLQVGGMLDLKGRPGLMAAMGLSLFGVEAQYRKLEGLEDPALAVLGKIRIPLGIIWYALETRR